MPTTDATEGNFSLNPSPSETTSSVPALPDSVNENKAVSMANADCDKALSSPAEASPAKPSSTSPASSDDSFESSSFTSHIASAADSLPCIELSFGKTQRKSTSSALPPPSTPFGDPGETDYPNKLTFKGITVTLESSKIWNDFHKCGTEMILTKQGRHMFPYCRYRISGLDPERKYSMVLSIPPADALKYKWNGKNWEVMGHADHLSQGLIRAFAHHYSPCTGAEWMKVLVSFKKLKVTNNANDQEGNIILHSLHRYIPRLHIIPVPDSVVPTADQPVVMGPESMTFTFPQTEFMAVTTYQNFRITQMKIRYNPFAKGFREEGNNPRLQRVAREIRYVSVETTGASATAKKEENHSSKEEPEPAKPIILKPIMSPFSDDANAYIHCRGKRALGNLVVVPSLAQEPKKEKNFIDLMPPIKLCISVNPKAKFRPTSSLTTPKLLSKYKKKRQNFKNWRNSWRKESTATPPTSPCPQTSPDPSQEVAVLDDMEGLLFVSFTSKAALDDHIRDQPAKTTAQDSSTSQSPLQFSQKVETVMSESQEEKLVRLEVQLLQDLQLLKHRQTIHPVLQEVGMKLSSLDPVQPIDLLYLGVQLPLPPKITSVVAGDMGLSFISRTGKTSDVTKIKGWRNKFVKNKLPQSDANHSEGPGSKNLSAFCSNMLDEYLENEERQISERAETFSSLPQGSVAYELPAKSSSYVKTLDSVLKLRTLPPPPASAPSPQPHRSPDLNSGPLSPASPAPSASPALSERTKTSLVFSPLTMAQRLSKFLPPKRSPELTPKPAPGPTPDTTPPAKALWSCDTPGLSKPQLKLLEMECGAWSKGLMRMQLTHGRLSVALSALVTKCTQLNEVFKVPAYQKPPSPPCGKEFCRLGCVCDSLCGHHKGAFRASFHCRRADCMFGCCCFKETITKNLFTAMTGPDASSSGLKTSTSALHSKKLWIKNVDDLNEEQLLIPEAAPNLPTVWPILNPSPKTGSKTGGKTSLPVQSLEPPPIIHAPVNQIREEDKDPVYKYLESKMTCARVRAFNCKPPPEETLAQITAADTAVTTPKTPTAANPTTTPPAQPKAPKTSTSLTNSNSTNPAEKTKEKPKSNVFVLKKKSDITIPHDRRRPRTLIEIQSTCKWAKDDRKMVLEALCLNMNRNRLCQAFSVGSYYIKPIAKLVMQKPSESVVTYKVQISLNSGGKQDHDKKQSEDEEDKMSKEKPAEAKEYLFSVGMTPFFAAIQPAGVLRATTAQSTQSSLGLVQVNGKFYSHARLMLGRMGSLHPANRIAAFVTGRLGGTSNLYKKPSSAPPPAPNPDMDTTQTPSANPTPKPPAVPPTVQRRPLVPQMLSSFQPKIPPRSARPTVKPVQPDTGKPSQINSMPPPPPPPPPSAPSPTEKRWTSPFQSACPVSITVSPSLKTPSFLGQKGSYSFRICPPDNETCKLPGVSLPGGFTLIQLPKPAPDKIPNLDQNNANSLLSQMVKKALKDQNKQPIVISDDSESSESDSGSDFTEDGEVDVDDELSVDVETVRETEEQLMVDRLRLAAGLGPDPQRRFVPRRYPLQLMSSEDNGTDKKHERKCSERQRRSEQRELFDGLQSLLKPSSRTPASKLHLLTLTTKEIKNLTDRCQNLENEKKLLTQIQNGYVQKISLMSGKPEETILEKLYDVCEKQKQTECMSSNSPYSDLLQSNAAMVQAISLQSRPGARSETTPLLKPIKLEATEERTRPEPSEAQRKASEQIQATAKNFLQQLLTKLKPIIDSAKIDHQVARTTRPILAKGTMLVPRPEEVSTSSALPKAERTKETSTKPPALALPLIRSKDGRIILPSNLKPAPQTYYTLTVAQDGEQRPTLFLKPLDPQQNLLHNSPDPDNPTVLVQQPIPLKPQPDSLKPYVFKSPLASIGYLNKTMSNQVATSPSNSNLTPNSEAAAKQTLENQPKTFPVVPNPVYDPFTTPPVKRGRGRPRKNPHPTSIPTPAPKLVIKDDPDYSPTSLSPSLKRPAEAMRSPRAAPVKRGRGRPPKARTHHILTPRVELERCPNPYSEVKKEEEEWDIDISNLHMNGSRPLTRAALGKDFPSAKKRSWIDLESELDVDIE